MRCVSYIPSARSGVVAISAKKFVDNEYADNPEKWIRVDERSDHSEKKKEKTERVFCCHFLKRKGAEQAFFSELAVAFFLVGRSSCSSGSSCRIVVLGRRIRDCFFF